MTTPPSIPSASAPSASHPGPLWTRNPKSSPKKHRDPSARPPGASAARPYPADAPSSTSSLSLAQPPPPTPQAQASANPPPAEPLYLTHVHRHHGHLTLVAPDNHGARRQPGTVDPPSARYDARGGFGMPGAMPPLDGGPRYPDEQDGDDPGEGDNGRKIKKKSKKQRKKEEEARRRMQIRQAVSNAGRTPSPSTEPARPLFARVNSSTTPAGPSSRSGEMARTGSGQAMLTVPSGTSRGGEQRERRSRSRTRTPRAEASTSNPPPSQPGRPVPPPPPPRPSQPASRPIPSSSTAAPDALSIARPAPSSAAPRRNREPRHVPSAAPQSTSPTVSSDPPARSHRRSLSPSYFPPPQILDDQTLESQISLGLVDPSMLLSIPPPAYVPPPPSTSTSNPLLPSEPPPPITAASHAPTPPLAPHDHHSSPPPPASNPAYSNAPSTVDDSASEDEDDSGPPDPLVVAWEEDRLTGLYSLDERIARDFERRRIAAGADAGDETGDVRPPGAPDQEGRDGAESPTTPSVVSAQSAPFNLSQDLPTASETQEAADDLNEIVQAEAARDSRRLSRALSRHASRRYSVGPGATSRRSTLLSPSGSTTGLGFGFGLSQVREARTPEERISPAPSTRTSSSTRSPFSSLATLPAVPSVLAPTSPRAPVSPADRSPRPSADAGPSDTLRVPLRSLDELAPPPLMSPAESSAVAAEFPSPSLDQGASSSPGLSSSSGSPVVSSGGMEPLERVATEAQVQDAAGEGAEEEQVTEEEEVPELARKVTRSGRGLVAFAAERRLRLEREERERKERGQGIGVVVEEEEEEPASERAIGPTVEATPTPLQPAPSVGAAPETLSSPTAPLAASPTEQRRPVIHASDETELAFSRPSSRSSFPRPAAPPQLVPLQPEPAPIVYAPPPPPRPTLSSSTRTIAPPPVPPPRLAGRRSLEEPATVQSVPGQSNSVAGPSARRPPPPPPIPAREMSHRASVRAIAAAMNSAYPRRPPQSPPLASSGPAGGRGELSASPGSRSISTFSTQLDSSLDSGSTGASSAYPSSLTGPRLPHQSLRANVSSPDFGSSVGTASSSSTSVDQVGISRRHRPLPIPPAPLSQDRLDAFTALRAVQGTLPPTSASTSATAPTAGQPASSVSPSRTAVTSSPVQPPAVEAQRPRLQPRLSSSSSTSSLEYPGPPLPRRPPQAGSTVAQSSATASEIHPSSPGQQPAQEQLSAYTDLDLLLARLEPEPPGDYDEDDSETPRGGRNGDATGTDEDGRNYDDLLTLGEIMGNVAPAGATAEELAEHLTVARVELERRRIDKRGKVKTKLSVVGVRCVDCSICMSRFRVDDFAVVLSNCLHIFHENCIRSWFRRSRVCPVCRADVFPPRPVEDLMTAP